MMKRFFLTAITAIVFLFISGNFQGYQDPEPAPKTLIQVNMLGRLIQPRTRTQLHNFLVFQNCKLVQINFINTLGAVDVEVLLRNDRSDSTVYKRRVMAAGGSEMAIEIGNWKQGKYVISVCDLEKTCANGEFEIK